MSGSVFVDTNVLVYARDSSDPSRQRRAASWLARLWDEGSGRLSHQVLQEFYVTVTRKLDPPADPAFARDDVAALATWSPVATDLPIMESAWRIEDRFGFSWWDALIVAQALASGCEAILTEDLQHGQDLFGVRVIDPFQVEP